MVCESLETGMCGCSSVSSALRDLVKVEDQGVRDLISVYCENLCFHNGFFPLEFPLRSWHLDTFLISVFPYVSCLQLLCITKLVSSHFLLQFCNTVSSRGRGTKSSLENMSLSCSLQRKLSRNWKFFPFFFLDLNNTSH